MGHPLPLMCSTVRQWPRFDVIGGTLQKKKKKGKICSHPPKSDPLARHSRHQRTFMCFTLHLKRYHQSIPGLPPGSGAAWGRFLSDHQITASARMHNPAWISFETIPLADSKFQKLLSGVVSQSASTGGYLVNHLHPVDLRKNIPLTSCSRHPCLHRGLQLQQ